MTQADLERRIHQLEQKIHLLEQSISEHERSIAVMATGITIARWLGPFIVSVATVVVIIAKG